ncbi:MAG: tetraacyldisaccharide 4'-kinase [Tenacibaculum sp.]
MKLFRFLLFPFAVLYDIITSIRNWFFDIGVLKATSFTIPVIAVGNLSVGGTGKTPQIEYLIRLLKQRKRIAVLSRGYKRKTKGFQIINDTHTTDDVGDEPMQFYKKFGNEVIVAVDADRTNGIQQLLNTANPPEIVLLDDAYQHRKVKASAYILLTKYNDLFVDDFILPTGNLRESKRGAKRAAAIVVTKCPSEISEKEQQFILKKIAPKKHQQVFFSTISYDEELEGDVSGLTISDLKNKEVLLVTGIANPVSLLQFLSKENIKFKHLKYPDHYDFTTKDILKIQTEFTQLPSSNKLILTTEKDYMRLENRLQNVVYVAIKNKFFNEETLFNDFVFSEIKS